MRFEKKSKYTLNIGKIWFGIILTGCIFKFYAYPMWAYGFTQAIIVAIIVGIFPWALVACISKDKTSWWRLIISLVIEVSFWGFMGMIPYVILIIYAFRIRNEITEKITMARSNKKKDVLSGINTSRVSKSLQNPQVKQERKQQAKVQQEEMEPQKEILKEEIIRNQDYSVKIDVNQCNEADFITLPGMSLVSAKRAVENREQNGDYESFDDFVARNGIKPHFMIQMESLVLVKKNSEDRISNTPKRGRMLDL